SPSSEREQGALQGRSAIARSEGCGLFFYLLNRINLPPVSPHFCFISGDPLNCDRLSDLRYLAWNLRYALRHDAVCSVHAHYFRAFTDANVCVAVVSFCHLGNEAAHSRMGCHFVSPAVRIFANQLTDRKFDINPLRRLLGWLGRSCWFCGRNRTLC